jgi:predicted AlkP superfamily pyrophosphatase or phosphodiesterase
VFVLLLAMVSSALSRAEPPDTHVVLITIDGFPARMFHDPKSSIPNIRALAADGVSAEGMEVSNPTVTWPNHTTLVTGVRPSKHSVLFNGILTRGGPGEPVRIDPRKDKKELVRVETIYDLLHGQGFTTGAIDWPCTRGAATLDDDFPDTPEPLSHSTPRLVEDLVREGILPNNDDATFRAMSAPARDEVWTRAACYVIGKRMPNLLLIHLLNTDGTHHKYGPQSNASYTAVALADKFVGDIVGAIDQAGKRGQTTIFVTADHGFATATKLIQPNVLLRQAGLIELTASKKVGSARAQVVSEGGTGFVYFNNPETKEQDRAKVLKLFANQEGLLRIIQPGEYSGMGYPPPEKNQGMAELVLVPAQGYAVSGGVLGDEFATPLKPGQNEGYHGFLASDPRMNALFVASGRGIRKGTKIGFINNVDVAPTIMHLFGKELPDADGKLLGAIFAE